MELIYKRTKGGQSLSPLVFPYLYENFYRRFAGGFRRGGVKRFQG